MPSYVKAYTFCCPSDPAFERGEDGSKEREAFEEAYRLAQDNGEWDRLPCRPKRKPRLFHLRALRGQAKVKVRHALIRLRQEARGDVGHGYLEPAYYLAAACAIQDWDNVEDSAGAKLRIDHFTDPEDGVRHVDEDVLAELYEVDSTAVFQVGLEAVRRAFAANPLS